MPVQLIDPKLIDPNRYQPASRLNLPGADLEDLISIRDIGFINTPRARLNPDRLGRVELIEGHRRVAAWSLYRGGAVPLDIVECGDRELFETMVIENAARKDLNAIQKAGLLRDHMQRFGSTQVEAGPLIGVSTQGAVSNLLSLLDLPVEIQALLASGALPERFARRFKPLRSLNADRDLIKIAADVAAVNDDTGDSLTGGTQENVLNLAIGQLLQSRARYISGAPWPATWRPGVPADVGSGQEDLPACEKCPFNRKINFNPYCLRPACYKAKFAVWARQATDKAAKARHITAAQPGEKVRRIDDVDLARRLLTGKPGEHIRLLPVDESDSRDYGARSYRKSITGSELTAVGIVEAQADVVLKAVRKSTPARPKTSPQTRSAADYTRQHNERQRAFQAAKKTLLDVFEALTPIVVARLPSDPLALSLIAGLLLQKYGDCDFPIDSKLQQEFDRKHTITAKPGELRLYLAHQILGQIDELIFDNPAKGLQQTRDALAQLAVRHKLTFPAGWDTPLLPAPSPVAKSDAKSKSAAKHKK